MTKKEAIQILSTRDAHSVLCGYTSGVTEALDMAIEALSADGNCNNCKEYGSYKCTRCDGEIYYKADGDLISRADAICEVLVNDGIDNIVDRINTLPSAVCDDCIWTVCNYNKTDWDAPSAEAEWIPCSERLPKTGDSVLVTYSDGEVSIVWGARPKAWVRYIESNNLIYPIAWMPLPKPHEEDGEA